MEHQKGKKYRCPVCLEDFDTIRKSKPYTCEYCGTRIPPLETALDGYIRVNWQDMRVLVIYARRWASMFDLTRRGNQDAARMLGNITGQVKTFRPQDGEKIEDDKIINRNIENTEEEPNGILSPWQRY